MGAWPQAAFVQQHPSLNSTPASSGSPTRCPPSPLTRGLSAGNHRFEHLLQLGALALQQWWAGGRAGARGNRCDGRHEGEQCAGRHPLPAPHFTLSLLPGGSAPLTRSDALKARSTYALSAAGHCCGFTAAAPAAAVEAGAPTCTRV